MPTLPTSSTRRVVVTGMGVNTVLGDTLKDYWDALVAGRSGITRWKRMDARILSKIGGDKSDFDLDSHLSSAGEDYPSRLLATARRLLRATPLSGILTCCATLQAYVDSGLHASSFVPERVAHVLAGHNLSAGYIVENVRIHAGEPEFIDPLFGYLALDTDVLSVASELLVLRGPSFTVGGACASGNLALLAGLDLLRAGRADVAVISGASVDLDPVTLHGWAMIDALAYKSFNEEPERASRPFDRLREGFVPSEGSAAVVLETIDHARRRNARPYAEIVGAAAVSDASRQTRPDEKGQVRAMREALRDAALAPTDIDYINAHATSTPLGDAVEIRAIKAVFGTDTYDIPINATKSMTGHSLTSAGVVEIITTILELTHGVVHPTINQDEKDPDIDVDVVPNASRQHRFTYGLSNAFGFGGINSCVVVGPVP